MKYLAKFENSFIPNNHLNQIDIHNTTQEYLQNLSESELKRLYSELETLATKHKLRIEDLQDPEVVKQVLTSLNEGFGSWLKDNWYNVVDKISKYGKIFAGVTFVGSLLSHHLTGSESVTGVKVAVASFIIASMVGTLKMLKEE